MISKLFISTTAETPKASSSSWRFFRRIAAMIRIIRIPALVVSVYGIGYQQGIIDTTRNPQAMQEQILRSALVNVGVVDLKQIKVLSEDDISYVSRGADHQVAAVGNRIISSARDFVLEELDKAMQEVQLKLPVDISPEMAMKFIKEDEKVEFWFAAAQRLFGEVNSTNILVDLLSSNDIEARNKSRKSGLRLKQVPWQYVFVNCENPNAFVSEILPHRIFITSAMLDLAKTPNELAMILGHEISHLILGHMSEMNAMETILRAVEVLLLSIDPTEGIFALAVIGGLVTMRRAFTAAQSRDQENQADDLGMQITARACYDTVKGAEIWRRMHEAQESIHTPASADKSSGIKPTGSAAELRLFDTHPPSIERYERLLEKAHGGENYLKYRHKQCATVSSRIASALGWG